MVCFYRHARLRTFCSRALPGVSFGISFLLGVLTVLFPVRAQTPDKAGSYPDSLLKVLAGSRTDTAKARVLYLLADYWSERDTTLAFRYVREGMEKSRSHPYIHALGYFYLAGNYFQSDIPLSERYYLKADSLLQSYKSREAYTFRSRLWHNYGVLQQIRDREKAFAEILIDKAIPLAEKAGDTLRIGRNYVSLGIIFTNQLAYKKAISYFKKAEAIFATHPPPASGLTELYLKFSRNYIFLKQFEQVPSYLSRAKQLLRKDSRSSFWPDYYLTEGMYLAGIGQFREALASLDNGIRKAPEVHRPEEVPDLLFQKYKIYREQKNYATAGRTLEAVMEVIRERPSNRNRLLCYYNMAEIQALRGNFKKAYDWLLRYATLSDSVNIQQTVTEVAALETRYQTAEKEKQILLLQAKNEKAQLTIRNNQLLNGLFGSASVFLLVVSILILLFYRNSRKMLQQQKQVHELELYKIKQDQRILQLSAMVEGQEQERTRLARDLHDGLGGLLSGIKIELSVLHGNHGDSGNHGIGTIINHLDDAVNELRRIARNLMPEILTKYGLAEATRDFCKNLNSPTGPNVICQVFNYRENLPKEKQTVLYRIIQELVNNAMKHADAGQILVILQQRDDTLFVTVEDDGKGFDAREASCITGSGIASVKARSEFLQARIDFQSAPGHGTTVTIECPVS